MKTTLIIDDTVFATLKQEAARQGKSLSALVESALRLFLAPKRGGQGKRRTLPSFHSGGHLVNIDDREALYRVMEEEDK